ncbi:hypothetical protein [Streptomyces termitum]|uniref:hypothetical protein n=1 Tax=Streptomyces termitum TaxID=67368 RepID=UPI0037B74BAD
MGTDDQTGAVPPPPPPHPPASTPPVAEPTHAQPAHTRPTHAPPHAPFAPPFPAAEPVRSEQPRWAWWVAGIALPLLGIVASVIVGMDRGDEPPAAATPPPTTASSPSSPASPSADDEPVSTPPSADDGAAASPLDPPDSPAPRTSAPAAGQVDLTAPAGHGPARESSWGLTPAPCTNSEQQLIDLDTGLSRVEAEDNGRIEEAGGAELQFWPENCTGSDDYRLRGVPNTRVGLLRADDPHTADTCRKMSNTGLPPMDLNNEKATEQAGFTVGAAICAVTAEGAVAMATIDHIGTSGIGGEATASGTLYVWPKAAS